MKKRFKSFREFQQFKKDQDPDRSIYNLLKKTGIAKRTFYDHMDDPEYFRVGEIKKIADFYEVSPQTILEYLL